MPFARELKCPPGGTTASSPVLIRRVPYMLRISLWILIRNISFAFQEQELYQREGLGVNEVHYVDNQDCIGMKMPLIIVHPWLCIQSSSSCSSSIAVLLSSECSSAKVLIFDICTRLYNIMYITRPWRRRKATQKAGYTHPKPNRFPFKQCRSNYLSKI